jgi:hypothetical protein
VKKSDKMAIIIILGALLIAMISSHCIAEGACYLIDLLEEDKTPKRRILVAVPIERTSDEHTSDSE